MNQRPNTRAPFPTTDWTLIQLAQQSSGPRCAEALEEIARHYWNPIYAYFRSKGLARHDAEDQAQTFIGGFVAKDKIGKLQQRTDSKFRAWLRTCLSRHIIDQARRAGAKSRAPDDGVASLDLLRSLGGGQYEPAAGDNPESAFDAAWRHDLIDRALAEVKRLCQRQGREQDFRVFVDYYCHDELERPTWEQVAARAGVESGKRASHMSEWVKKQLHKAIRHEISKYVASEEEIEEEIRDLCI